ncbi:MAG: hypothetical protein K5675_10220 [Lachnospiraceae bacterium]|nr:hypothetical protein [Lachnospiraceae bacterium]
MTKRKKVVEEKIKKRKKAVFRTYFLHIFMALAIILVAGVLIIGFFFSADKVTFSGNTILSDSELAGYLFTDKYSNNTVYCWGKNLLCPREDIPFVESVKMKLKNPNTLQVIIKEKTFVGRMTDSEGNNVYFDSENNVKEVSTTLLDSVVEVTMEDVELSGLSVGDVLPLKTKRKRELSNLFRYLEEQSISVSSIHFTDEGGITINYKNILINLGTSSNLEAKILRLRYILPQIEDQSGTLHLEDWSEGNRDIVFEKNE